ncbi:hypothetical protein MKEN_00045100 [Mycena kentingensis (nom. inval.)]|nr:hypothetical protein MKEN_00045100 [Mycena kentingensis (nom. inval.)]
MGRSNQPSGSHVVDTKPKSPITPSFIPSFLLPVSFSPVPHRVPWLPGSLWWLSKMRYSTSILAALASAPLLVSSAPVRSRAASANDALVFQFANVLEQLETKFYAEGIAKFTESDFTSAGFSSALIATETLTVIQADEAAHTDFIQQALKDNGAEPLVCDFDFSSVLTDVATMAAVARKVEMVGVSAYLGGATLIDDTIFLDAAASILSIEARHQTVLNLMSGTGSAIPQAFDIPLRPEEILAIAGGFIKAPCDLGITPAKTLTVTTANPQVGSRLEFSGEGVETSGQFCNMITGGMPFSINLPIEDCVVPPGVNGPVAIWITSDNNPLANNVVDRDSVKQVAGPDIIFIDSVPETLGQLVRGSGTSSGATSSVTTTISPEDAAKVIAGASTGESAPEATATSGGEATATSGGEEGEAANGASAPASTPLPKDFTGESPDKKTNVLGLSMVPRPAASSTATDSAAPSSTSS